MTAEAVLGVWESGILLMGLLVGWFYLRADYEVDCFRQEMFTLRDEMFDYASNGGIAYDHPAYTQLRDLANGLIRFAHRMTLWRILVMFGVYWCFGVRRTPTFDADLERNITSIGSVDARQEMRAFHRRMAALMAWQIMRSSCLFWPLILCGFSIRLLKKARVQKTQSPGFRVAAESTTVQKAIPTNWIEEQAICA